jgi:hypothetical protein
MGVSRYNQVDNRKGANFNLYIYRGINKYEKVKKTLSKRKLVVDAFFNTHEVSPSGTQPS